MKQIINCNSLFTSRLFVIFLLVLSCKTKRNWAITEHMKFNGSDFLAYSNVNLQLILGNTLYYGMRFGWEFTNVPNSSSDVFCLYRNDSSVKNVISIAYSYW